MSKWGALVLALWGALPFLLLALGFGLESLLSRKYFEELDRPWGLRLSSDSAAATQVPANPEARANTGA